jgi:hypothetical protein
MVATRDQKRRFRAEARLDLAQVRSSKKEPQQDERNDEDRDVCTLGELALLHGSSYEERRRPPPLAR